MLSRAAFQGSFNRPNERAGGLRAQFDGHPEARPHVLVHEVDVQGVLKRRVEWVIIVDVRARQREPALGSLAAAGHRRRLSDIRAHREPPLLSARAPPPPRRRRVAIDPIIEPTPPDTSRRVRYGPLIACATSAA